MAMALVAGDAREAGGGGGNRLLRLLPEPETRRLSSIGEEIAIHPRQILHHWGLPMDYVFFLHSGLVSVSTKVDESGFLEVWLIGSEGMVGAPLVLVEEDSHPAHRRVVQVGGTALRVPAREFSALLPELPALRMLVLRYINVVLFQTSQSGACNAAHSLKQRLARWLLVARNGLESDNLPLTHEVLGRLLGVRRASVSECLEELQRNKVIKNTRGSIVIENAALLERICCNCFRLIDHEYQRQMKAVRCVLPQDEAGHRSLGSGV